MGTRLPFPKLNINSLSDQPAPPPPPAPLPNRRSWSDYNTEFVKSLCQMAPVAAVSNYRVGIRTQHFEQPVYRDVYFLYSPPPTKKKEVP